MTCTKKQDDLNIKAKPDPECRPLNPQKHNNNEVYLNHPTLFIQITEI